MNSFLLLPPDKWTRMNSAKDRNLRVATKATYPNKNVSTCENHSNLNLFHKF